VDERIILEKILAPSSIRPLTRWQAIIWMAEVKKTVDLFCFFALEVRRRVVSLRKGGGFAFWFSGICGWDCATVCTMAGLRSIPPTSQGKAAGTPPDACWPDDYMYADACASSILSGLMKDLMWSAVRVLSYANTFVQSLQPAWNDRRLCWPIFLCSKIRSCLGLRDSSIFLFSTQLLQNGCGFSGPFSLRAASLRATSPIFSRCMGSCLIMPEHSSNIFLIVWPPDPLNPFVVFWLSIAPAVGYGPCSNASTGERAQSQYSCPSWGR